jgi:hypothetical protein
MRRVRGRPDALLCLAALALQGCSSTPTPSAQVQTGKTGGVCYEVRGEGGAVTKGVAESGSFTAGQNTLEFRGGRVFANGKDHGPVKGGDSVLLDRDGDLSVNGRRRPAE